MRAKTRRTGRQSAAPEARVGSPPLADWLVRTEVGGGTPHLLIALAALAAVCARAIAAVLTHWRSRQRP